MPVGVSIGGIGITLGSSARYCGGSKQEDGPLVSTVNEFLGKVAGGDVGAIQQLYALGVNANQPGRACWKKVWQVEVPKIPLLANTAAYIVQLDPLMAGQLNVAGNSTPPPSGSSLNPALSTQTPAPTPATGLGFQVPMWMWALGLVVAVYFGWRALRRAG